MREFKGLSKIKLTDNYVVLDIETTGLDSDFDEIIEIGALKVVGGKIVDIFNELVKPNACISDFISNLTGITNEMLVDARQIDEVLPRFIQFAKNMVIVGHNINFDINFIYDNTIKVLDIPFSNDYIDTLRLSRKVFKDLENHKLSTICDYLNIAAEIKHRAIADCDMTYRLYEYIKQKFNNNEEDLLKLFQQKIHKNLKAKDIKTNNRNFDDTHVFFNKNCVFTGSLSISRRDAMQQVVDVGGICQDNVTRKTNFLILGNNDYRSSEKSSKHKKAEEYIIQGFDIQIISENLFMQLIMEQTKGVEQKTICHKNENLDFKDNVDNLIKELNICFEHHKDYEVDDNLSFDFCKKAMELEKNNEIDDAIKMYEKAMFYGFQGNYVYDRLLILYKKKSDVCKIKETLERAIFVFYNIVNKQRVDRINKLEKYYFKYLKLL